MLCRRIQTTLLNAHTQGAVAAVEHALAYDDNLEVSLNYIASTWHLLLHGNSAGAMAALAVRPGGTSDLVPPTIVEKARTASRDGYREADRTVQGWTGGIANQLGWTGAVPYTPAAGLTRRNVLPKVPNVPKPKPKG